MSKSGRHNATAKRRQSNALTSPAPMRSDPTQSGRPRQFDLPVEPRAPLRWPSISVCMIVKNEAENLRPCLESLEDLASEVIVVDTGSSDGTVEIAREMGAKVFHFPWIDDFAAARNESISHATKEWVFWLDADDRLDSKAVAQLKAAAASGKADAYMAMVCSSEPDSRRTITEHIRLFANRLGIQFTGAIHEGVFVALVQLGLTLARTDISVEHLGYNSPDNIRRKTARNLAIIERELACSPERTDLIFYRGQARGSIGDSDGAMADMSNYLAHTTADGRFNHLRFWACSILARLQLEAGDLASAKDTMLRAKAEFPGHPHFLHLSGSQHLVDGETEEGLKELLAARDALQGPVLGFRPADWWIEGRLAQGYRGLGRRAEALRWAELASAHEPDSTEAWTLLARLYLETGRTAEAETAASRLSRIDFTPEPWLILAEARHRLGRWAEADEALSEAQSRGLPEEQVVEIQSRMKATRILAGTESETATSAEQLQIRMQGLALLAKQDHTRAAECFARAIQIEPSAPDNYKYLAVALQALGHEEQALEAWRVATHLNARRKPDEADAQLEVVQAV